MYNFEFVKGKGLQVKINEDELEKIMDDERKEDARITNLEEKDSVSQDESDNPAWDMQ